MPVFPVISSKVIKFVRRFANTNQNVEKGHQLSTVKG